MLTSVKIYLKNVGFCFPLVGSPPKDVCASLPGFSYDYRPAKLAVPGGQLYGCNTARALNFMAGATVLKAALGKQFQ